MGNHRDAWVFGAIDPSSGTAVMMEASRVMGELVKSGKSVSVLYISFVDVRCSSALFTVTCDN